MQEVFKSKEPRLDVAVEQGRSGDDECEGYYFLFRGLGPAIVRAT